MSTLTSIKKSENGFLSSVMEIPDTFRSCLNHPYSTTTIKTASIILPIITALAYSSCENNSSIVGSSFGNISNASMSTSRNISANNTTSTTLGLLFAQGIFSLGIIDNLFGFSRHSQKIDVALDNTLLSRQLTPKKISQGSESSIPDHSPSLGCALGFLALNSNHLTLKLAGIPLLTFCLNLPGVSANILDPFPKELNIHEYKLNGPTGLSILKRLHFEEFGYSVSSAGDINGDGIPDLIIGAGDSSELYRPDRGNSYVVFGSKKLQELSAKDKWVSLPAAKLDGSNGFRIEGKLRNRESGFTVKDAGDVNADGFADLLIGDFTANNSAGMGYVVFGSKQIGENGLLKLEDLDGSNGFSINGTWAGDMSGYSVSNSGDINADGITDLIIGAPGANNSAGLSFVIFGSKNLGKKGYLLLSELNGTNGFSILGGLPGDESGISVSTAGDVNADGIADLVIGTSGKTSGKDRTYIVFGSKQLGKQKSLSLDHLNGSNGFTIRGSNSGHFHPQGVANCGDVNGDGIDDVMVSKLVKSEYSFTTGNSCDGIVHVIFGSKNLGKGGSLSLDSINGPNGFVIENIASNFIIGGEGAFSLSGGGDLNGDGIADILIGTKSNDPEDGALNSPLNGYVLFGSKQLGAKGSISFRNMANMDSSLAFRIKGLNHLRFGSSVSFVGDVNKDGIDDFMISNPNDQVVLIFGRNISSKTSVQGEEDILKYVIPGVIGFVLVGGIVCGVIYNKIVRDE